MFYGSGVYLIVAEPDFESLESIYEFLVLDVPVPVHVKVVERALHIPGPHGHKDAFADLVHDGILPLPGIQAADLRIVVVYGWISVGNLVDASCIKAHSVRTQCTVRRDGRDRIKNPCMR